jgi:CubicO group peptidase (beta-lactamase class C family)
MDAGWGYGYGYYWWLYQMDGHEVFIAWGYGGQLVYLVPDLNMVVVFTTNTKDYSEDFDGEHLISQYVIPSAGKSEQD